MPAWRAESKAVDAHYAGIVWLP
ncbi:hypothetical protein XFF6994_1660004 [Xanthomonas citri pv. fuscans]|nr:hypothetical protein XFF6994_1660004 [Xanthomonas citri pv. fuscans]